MVAMLMDDQEAFHMAEQFFGHDYHDRGMVKWQGYYLSDHTEDADKHERAEEAQRNQIEMTSLNQEEIGEILFKAYSEGQFIEYQLANKSALGLYSPICEGKVNGYVENDVYIGSSHVLIENINWCHIKDDKK